jgi:hypothetical protein
MAGQPGKHHDGAGSAPERRISSMGVEGAMSGRSSSREIRPM